MVYTFFFSLCPVDCPAYSLAGIFVLSASLPWRNVLLLRLACGDLFGGTRNIVILGKLLRVFENGEALSCLAGDIFMAAYFLCVDNTQKLLQ